MSESINLLQLYPRDMNIYGDWGNTLVLKRRLEWHGYEVNLLEHNPGDDFPSDVDIIVGGGGQDSGQSNIEKDLIIIGPRLAQLAEDGVPMLMICGLYQLFGHFFETREGSIIQGIGVLDIETRGGNERLIGNIVTHSDEFGDIVGYENHSGMTTLGPKAQAFGTVIRGAGNNGKDSSEGARYRNVIGTYLHGSLLPKNPAIADYLIGCAVTRKYTKLDSRKIPAVPGSPEPSISSFSAVGVAKTTPPSDKRSSGTILINPEDGEVLRESSIFKPTLIHDDYANQARAIAIKRPR